MIAVSEFLLSGWGSVLWLLCVPAALFAFGCWLHFCFLPTAVEAIRWVAIAVRSRTAR